MNKDRVKICSIISNMLDNPGDSGIYKTSTAYVELEHYIEQERIQAIGATHALMCILLDNGKDPRTEEVPDILGKIISNLKKE